jgi:hypothetical protein
MSKPISDAARAAANEIGDTVFDRCGGWEYDNDIVAAIIDKHMTPEVKNQGQGGICVCKHNRFYHSSWGNCMVQGCECIEWIAPDEQ